MKKTRLCSAHPSHLLRCGILIAASLEIAFNPVSHAQPQSAGVNSVSFQGALKGNDGKPLPDQTYDLTFRFWDGPNPSSQLVSTNILVPMVAAVGGVVSTVIPVDPVWFNGATRYLGVAIDGVNNGFELLPRVLITAVPYAVHAANSDAAVSAGSLTSPVPDSLLSSNIPRLDGNATFTGPVQFSNGASSFRGVFSGDGAGITNVSLPANPAFTLSPKWLASSPLSLTGIPYYIIAADLNADGKVDLVSATKDPNRLNVMTNDGHGGFVLSSSPTVGDYPNSVAAADVNGDGKLDLISANSNANSLTILLNNGEGRFALSSSPAVGLNPVSVIAADVNGDGKVDLISANSHTDSGDPLTPPNPGNSLTVLTNDGKGHFVRSSSPIVGLFPQSVAAADVNGDGKIDLISANHGGNGTDEGNTLTILTNDGRGGFLLSSSPIVGRRPTSVISADVNGDGKIDLISANNGNSTLTVLTNDGRGGFLPSSSPTVGQSPRSVTAVDVNGDGKVDLVSANATGSLTVLTNNGSGGFALSSSPPVGLGPISVAAADVNGDGRVDLISANQTDKTLTVLLNETFATFNGSGAGLVNLPVTSLVGTIQDSNLSGNVALLSGNQTFTGKNTFSGAVTAQSFETSSDRNLKEKVEPVEPAAFLQKVDSLPISTWSFKSAPEFRHIGPMAQDFYATFQVGADDKHIATIDENGVALAAIQGLHKLVREKDSEIARLKSDLQVLRKEMQDEFAVVKSALAQSQAVVGGNKSIPSEKSEINFP